MRALMMEAVAEREGKLMMLRTDVKRRVVARPKDGRMADRTRQDKREWSVERTMRTARDVESQWQPVAH